MPEAPYSNRELDSQFCAVHEKLDAILAQCMKTNGRVTALEISHAENRGKAKITSILWGGVASIVVAVVAFFINKQT